jgi:NAD(P)-dependent dehydrogenase (short-subunit alcohol dehydrogenase family)
VTRVLVTGAAGGIGTATAAALRRNGATVVGLDLAGADIDCDVRDQASVDRAVAEAIDRLGGGLDVLINNAGLGTPQSAAAAPDADALDVLAVNLVGPWRVTSAALEALRASRGRVINVASGLAHITVPFAPAYTMSKRGVVAYSDSLRLEEGDRITVTSVYPGYIRTRIHERSTAAGVPLEGAVGVERVEDAARALTRAALGPPVRDLATTRQGELAYTLARLAPRRLLDRITAARMRRLARRGHFDASGLAGEYAARLKG